MKVKEPKKLRGRNPSITKKGALSTDRFPHVYIFNINMKDLSKSISVGTRKMVNYA